MRPLVNQAWTDLNYVGLRPPAGRCPGRLKAPRASTLNKSAFGLLCSAFGLAPPSLALPAPRNNSPAAFGGRAARSAAAVVAGAGKASEADARRGEPSKPRPGEHADPDNDKLRRTTTTYDELRRATSYDELAKSISRDVPEYPDILA